MTDIECLDIVYIEAETIWVAIGPRDQHKLIIEAFYQPPDSLLQPIDVFECEFGII